MSWSLWRAAWAYVRPSSSENSTSYATGLSTSTTVPTWPRTNPFFGRSTVRATISSSRISRFIGSIRNRSSLEFIAGKEMEHVLSDRGDPTGSDNGGSAGGSHFKVEHGSLAVTVALARVEILRAVPSSFE